MKAVRLSEKIHLRFRRSFNPYKFVSRRCQNRLRLIAYMYDDVSKEMAEYNPVKWKKFVVWLWHLNHDRIGWEKF